MATANLSGDMEFVFEDIAMADNDGKPITINVTVEISYEAYVDGREPFNDDLSWSIDRFFEMSVTDNDGDNVFPIFDESFRKRLVETINRTQEAHINDTLWAEIQESVSF